MMAVAMHHPSEIVDLGAHAGDITAGVNQQSYQQ
jgi:hypothetical protein